MRACVHDDGSAELSSISRGEESDRKINNCRKEFIGLSSAPSARKTLARRRYFLIISLARGSDVDSRGEIIRFVDARDVYLVITARRRDIDRLTRNNAVHRHVRRDEGKGRKKGT